jgi:Uma2 family endonuclease
MAMPQPVMPQLSEAAFLLWEKGQRGKFELHLGFVYAVSGGTLSHDRIAFNIRTLLERQLRRPCRTYGSDVKVRISSNTCYYPDLTVSCEEVDDSATILGRPKIVVEVLSPSTQEYDLVEKRAAYREMPALRAYAIAHSDSRRVEVDRRNAAGSWETEVFDSGDALVDGYCLSLDQIYAGTALARAE